MNNKILLLAIVTIYLTAVAYSVGVLSESEINTHEINLDGVNFTEIDRHAIDTPEWALESVGTLADYLVEPARNDLEKVRAIYRWITENIAYDVEGVATGSYGDASPDGVLKSRKSYCMGYSGLFESLANASGLEAVSISGYAKGYNYLVGSEFEGPGNHAWNAVKINGTWHLLDSTWGAGYVDESYNFISEREDYHFLTPPDEFIYRHFPDDPSWQLLDSPISKSEFERLAYLRPAFFKYGLRLGSNFECIIVTDNETNISLFVPDDVLVTAELKKGDKKLLKSLTFAQRESDRYMIYAALPDTGNYTLSLYVKHIDDPGSYDWAADYKIIAKSGTGKMDFYPETYDAFIREGVRLYMPMTYFLRSGDAQAFKLEAPHALDVLVLNGDEYTHLPKVGDTGDLFEGEALLKEGDVKVFASYFGNESYDGLLKYAAV